MAIGIDCACMETLVPRVHVVMTAVHRPCCVASYMMCEGLCGERHQEDPPMDDVVLFGGAHICKSSGICCCIHDTLMNVHLYMHDVYIYYT